MPDLTSLERKAAQLFWVTVHGATGSTPHEANQRDFGVATPLEVIRRFRPGGIVLFAWADNTGHPAQVAQLNGDLRAAAEGAPLGIAIDEEGGRVARLGPPATAFPSARAVTVAGDDELAIERWRAAGRELADLGITTNLAPVVDLANPWNPVVGDRAFAEDPATVAAQAALAVRGLEEEGVAAVAKHFPGHGATEVDSHLSLPVVDAAIDEVGRHVDAFRRLFALRPPTGIMPGHLLVRALDPHLPATLSPTILDRLLRRDLGFDGAVVTDSLSMAGIRGGDDDAQVAVAALRAGADVLLTPPDLVGSIAAVCDAVRRGEVSEQRLDDAVRRGHALRTGVAPRADGGGAASADQHRRVADRIARAAVQVVRGADRLPLVGRPLLVAGASGSGARGLVDALAARGRPALLVELPWRDESAARLAAAGQGAQPTASPAPAGEPFDLRAIAGGLDEITVVLVRRVPELDADGQDRLLQPLGLGAEDVVLVETGGVGGGAAGGCVIRSHDASPPALAAVADVLSGRDGTA